MPTAAQLREALRPRGVKSMWKMRKVMLLWCKLAEACQAKLRNCLCPLTQEGLDRPFLCDGLVFERSELRTYLLDHALDVANPVTRKFVSEDALRALQLNPEDLRERCAKRLRHSKEVDSACEAYDIVLMEFQQLIRQDTPEAVTMTLEGLATILRDLPVVDAVLKDLCVASWRQKREQLKGVLGDKTFGLELVVSEEPEEEVD